MVRRANGEGIRRIRISFLQTSESTSRNRETASAQQLTKTAAGTCKQETAFPKRWRRNPLRLRPSRSKPFVAVPLAIPKSRDESNDKLTGRDGLDKILQNSRKVDCTMSKQVLLAGVRRAFCCLRAFQRTVSKAMNGEMTVVMDSERMADTLRRLAREICANNPDIESLALLGNPQTGASAGGSVGGADRRDERGNAAGGFVGHDALPRRSARGGGPGQVRRGGDALRLSRWTTRTVVLVDDVLGGGAGRFGRALDEVMGLWPAGAHPTGVSDGPGWTGNCPSSPIIWASPSAPSRMSMCRCGWWRRTVRTWSCWNNAARRTREASRRG